MEKENELTIDGIKYINLLSHPVKIKSGAEIYEFGKYKKETPRLQSMYELLEDEPMDTYKETVLEATGLPKQEKDTVLIVSLFILNGYKNIHGFTRQDLRSPGKKVYSTGGKTAFAVGLKKAD